MQSNHTLDTVAPQARRARPRTGAGPDGGQDGARARTGGSAARRGSTVDEKEIFARINELVEEEHRLRGASEHTPEQRARMTELEAHLDQAWDLLRQRRAKSQYG